MPKKQQKKNFLKEGFLLPKVEEGVLSFWKQNQIFEKSLKLRKGKKTFVFFEGPPGANGRPGIHHMISRVFKDVIPRYKTMQGYFVPRKSGWDTHGLPVELSAEKELGLKSKKDIENYGIAEFNQKCRELVWQYEEEWKKFTERIGFWVDLENPYVTYENSYIESLWWIITRFYEKGHLFKGHKVVPWCSRCGTALSSHELALGYKETKDNSVYVAFHVPTLNASVLSWTTTPWTLPGNVALAIHPKLVYVVAERDGEGGVERFIFAKDRAEALKPIVKYDRIVEELNTKNLIGQEYEPLFSIPKLSTDTSYKIYPADFVTATDGTGVVHTAVMYGEDDYVLGESLGLPQHHTVTEEGTFTSEVPDLAGLKAKSKEAEEKIFEHLGARKNLVAIEAYTHEYPFCWRCDTPLLYYARTSWFVGMPKLKPKLLKSNAQIQWNPKHIKEGRFGEWLRGVKDWNFSRERYWGTPLPIWECDTCDEVKVVSSMKELIEGREARNKYFLLRHGESETQMKRVIDSGKGNYNLTLKGRVQVERSVKSLKKKLGKKGVDLILSSPILRTKQSAEIAQKVLGVDQVYFDSRLEEIHLGPKLEGCHSKEYHAQFPTYKTRFEHRPEGGESLRDLRARVALCVADLEEKYQGKNILIVSHEYPIWMLSHAAEAWTEQDAVTAKGDGEKDFIKVGEVRELKLLNLPKNTQGEVDLHRPYIDQVRLKCPQCEGEMCRVKEVADVWFDSGAMPLAQWHYPFEEKQAIDGKKMYPADYICEGVDQTRGWFYTLVAVATALGMEAPFKNAISLGHILDKNGQKMSKSKGNVVSPWEMAEKHGVDAVRWYFFSATPPGEPKKFDEQELVKAFRRFHAIVYNSFVFYETYALKQKGKLVKPSSVLDQWILSRLNETILEVTKKFDQYEVRDAALALESFVDDLSRWYIRRSRRRLQKPENKKDFESASKTLGFVLNEFSKLMAPFTPFFAESIYGALAFDSNFKESVHLADWPKASKRAVNKKLSERMAEVRRLASEGLAKRAVIGQKVRQPLASISIGAKKSLFGGKEGKALEEILKDEVNVKKVIFDSKLKDEVIFDTVLTKELKEEGLVRELTRLVQDLRQSAGLSPQDKVALFIDTMPLLAHVFEYQKSLIMKEVGAKRVTLARTTKFLAEEASTLDGEPIWIAIAKA